VIQPKTLASQTTSEHFGRRELQRQGIALENTLHQMARRFPDNALVAATRQVELSQPSGLVDTGVEIDEHEPGVFVAGRAPRPQKEPSGHPNELVPTRNAIEREVRLATGAAQMPLECWHLDHQAILRLAATNITGNGCRGRIEQRHRRKADARLGGVANKRPTIQMGHELLLGHRYDQRGNCHVGGSVTVWPLLMIA
jgi:hypothetical protein